MNYLNVIGKINLNYNEISQLLPGFARSRLRDDVLHIICGAREHNSPLIERSENLCALRVKFLRLLRDTEMLQNLIVNTPWGSKNHLKG
jgi:hypothetical protein